MNLFRSEEHVRNWLQFNPDSSEGILRLDEEVSLLSAESRKHALDEDFVSRWLPRRAQERDEVLRRLGKTSSYWQPA